MWRLTVVVVLTAAVCCGGVAVTTGPRDDGLGLMSRALQALPVARALKRIRDSARDYRLMDDLWFEKIPENDDGVGAASRPLKSPPPPPGNLAELADAVFDTHRLLWRNPVLDGIDLIVYKDKSQRYTVDILTGRASEIADGNTHDSDHRTFGVHRRRMQFMLPIMYKLGVIITLLFGLTVISLKGVTIGMILLMLSVTSIVAKISKAHHDTQHYSYGLPSSPWSSFPHDIYDRSSMPQPQLQQSPDKNIHVHVYTAPGATTTKSRPTFDFDGSFAPSDDSAGGVNWSYDAPTNTYYQRNRGVGGAPETTTYY